MVIGPPLQAAEVKETGWYWLERRGPPRGYVYISADADNHLWLNSLARPIELRPALHGTFYKVPDSPVETSDVVLKKYLYRGFNIDQLDRDEELFGIKDNMTGADVCCVISVEGAMKVVDSVIAEQGGVSDKTLYTR